MESAPATFPLNPLRPPQGSALLVYYGILNTRYSSILLKNNIHYSILQYIVYYGTKARPQFEKHTSHGSVREGFLATAVNAIKAANVSGALCLA